MGMEACQERRQAAAWRGGGELVRWPSARGSLQCGPQAGWPLASEWAAARRPRVNGLRKGWLAPHLPIT
jgi:hypothetical protein